MENLLRVFQKQKKKKYIKRLSFITQFKIKFLLPFSDCRKVPGKMPGFWYHDFRNYLFNHISKWYKASNQSFAK